MIQAISDVVKHDFDDETRRQGKSYFFEDRIELTTNGHSAIAFVEGDSDDFLVRIEWTRDRRSATYTCSCRRFNRAKPCKHVWASLCELDIQHATEFAKELAYEDIEDLEHAIADGNFSSLSMEKTWRTNLQKVRNARNEGQVEFQAVDRRQLRYVITIVDIRLSDDELNLHIFSRTKTKTDKYSAFRPTNISTYNFQIPNDCNQNDRKTLELLSGFTTNTYHGYSYRKSNQNTVAISNSIASFLLPDLASRGQLFLRFDDSDPVENAAAIVWDADPPWECRLEVTENSAERNWAISATLVRGDQYRPVGNVAAVSQNGLLFFEDSIGQLNSLDMLPWVSHLASNSIQVPFEDRTDFLHEMSNLGAIGSAAELPESLQVERITLAPQGRLELLFPEANGGSYLCSADVSFQYDDTRFGMHDPEGSRFDEASNRVIVRDQAEEQSRLQQLVDAGLVRAFHAMSSHFSFPLKDSISVISQLLDQGWIVESKGKKYSQANSFNFEVTSDVDWFDVKGVVDFDGTQIELPTLLRALRQGEKTILLDDGTHGILPEQWLAKQERLLQLADVDGDSVRFRPSQALMLDALLAEQDNVQVDRSFSRYRSKLKNLDGIKPGKEPRGFKGELRAYQKDGVGWFKFLRDFDFGGCLADDMGLGKTVQVLALLQSRKLTVTKNKEQRSTSLVIVPKSLIFNWMDEAKKFAPSLRIANYTGSDRRTLLSSFQDTDMVLTTYGTMRRDVELLKDIPFDYVILDEAQAIKNHQSMTAKASRLLQGRNRLAMTGTPIENHLGELWSLFEFLNPGLLGASAAFQSFSRGAKDGDEGAISMLSQALKPFILRRTKTQVLDDLPEKTEQTLYCEIIGKQRKYYDELRDFYRSHLNKQIKAKGLQRSKFHVLEALLRLRQAACHPGLIDEDRIGDASAKLDLLWEQVEALAAEGHKALVFSQFTSLLAILRSRLDKQKVKYAYLDGKTTKRGEIVKQFQEDADTKLFLISLKAGGHGLNLTAAEYVFILDPWWNPAVEAQAIDRAHRMGQDKRVFAYRIIAKDTVEEKILQMQSDKRDLADAIVGADDSIMRNISADDLQMLLS